MPTFYSTPTPAQKRLLSYVRINGGFSYTIWGGKLMNHLPTRASLSTLDCLVGGGWLIRKKISPFGYAITLNPDAKETAK
jgi:hypothetical protein